ncbi:MAG TPA: DUF4129 domain-containing protein [Armatimonadetes bacterium]|nr:DUF4129 domain-containing protein [Armatimonadota bacterium]
MSEKGQRTRGEGRGASCHPLPSAVGRWKSGGLLTLTIGVALASPLVFPLWGQASPRHPGDEGSQVTEILTHAQHLTAEALTLAEKQPALANRRLHQARRALANRATKEAGEALSAVRRTLTQALEAEEGEEKRALVEQAGQQLASLLALTRLSTPAVDRAAAKHVLAQILASQEFQRARRAEYWWARFYRWLSSLLDWLFNRLFPNWHLSKTLAEILALILTALVLGVFAILVAGGLVTYWRWRRIGKRGTGEAQVQSRRVRTTRPSVELLLTEAEAQAQASDYRQALRRVYQALLWWLDEQGLIDYKDSRTNGEYLALLRERAEEWLWEQFREVTSVFEAVWYGGQPASAEQYQWVRDRCGWMQDS